MARVLSQEVLQQRMQALSIPGPLPLSADLVPLSSEAALAMGATNKGEHCSCARRKATQRCLGRCRCLCLALLGIGAQLSCTCRALQLAVDILYSRFGKA